LQRQSQRFSLWRPVAQSVNEAFDLIATAVLLGRRKEFKRISAPEPFAPAQNRKIVRSGWQVQPARNQGALPQETNRKAVREDREEIV
jgi:hypothetical protein